MAWDRYAYGLNSPVRYVDPTGHSACDGPNGGDPDCKGLKIFRRPKPVKPDKLSLDIGTKIEDKPDKPAPFSAPSESGMDPNWNNQCTTAAPCLSSWNQPSWWDTDPRNPDYYALSGSFGEGFGVTFTLTIDRYGNVYLAGGGNVGKSLAAGAVSLNGGWIGSSTDNVIPDHGNISEFFTEFSVNGSVGALGNVAAMWSPGAGDYLPHTSFEYGGLIPASAGVSVTYGKQIWPWR